MYQGTLDNGLRWLIAPEKGDLIAVLIVFGVGSRDESKEHTGISHFLEHMMFKGSKKYPDNVEAFKKFDAIGSEFNAYTSNDQTGYHTKFYKNHLETVLSTMVDAVRHPLLKQKDITKERTVVYEEIDMMEDDPDLQVSQIFSEAIFEDHPLGQNIVGKKKRLKNVNKKELTEYHNKYYCPSNAVVVLVGDLQKKETLKLIKKYLNKGWTDRGCQVYRPRFFESKRKEPLIIVNKTETDQEHLIIGFPTFGYYDSRRYAAELLNVIVGATFTSHLFVEVREKRGLVYGIKSGLKLFEEGGYFFIRSAMNKKNLPEVLKITLEVLKKMKTKLVSKEDLKKAKTHLEGSGKIKETDVMNLALFYGVQTLYHQSEVMTYVEYMKKIKSVTREEIQEVARDIFDFNKIVVALVGVTDKKGIEQILKSFVK